MRVIMEVTSSLLKCDSIRCVRAYTGGLASSITAVKRRTVVVRQMPSSIRVRIVRPVPSFLRRLVDEYHLCNFVSTSAAGSMRAFLLGARLLFAA